MCRRVSEGYNCNVQHCTLCVSDGARAGIAVPCIGGKRADCDRRHEESGFSGAGLHVLQATLAIAKGALRFYIFFTVSFIVVVVIVKGAKMHTRSINPTSV